MSIELQPNVEKFLAELSASEKYPRLNIYVCRECRGHIVTSDLVPGVTPFMIGCRATTGSECKGMMQSSMYRVFDQTMLHSHEWHRPDNLEGLSDWETEHVMKGGLLLRERVPA